MKDRLKQTVAIGLAGLMILSCAAGCGASKQEPEAVQAEDTPEQKADLSLSPKRIMWFHQK